MTKQVKEMMKNRKKQKQKETGPALQSIIANNLLGCLHRNARRELMDSF
jgi:hypothetical protein